MVVRLSARVRNGMLDSIETTIGVSPTLFLRTGSLPATIDAADTGTLVSSMVLPSDWMNASSLGVKTLQGVWQKPASEGAGVVGHFRIKQAGATDIEGTVTQTGGGGDMTLDNTNIAIDQQITITSFTMTASGGA